MRKQCIFISIFENLENGLLRGTSNSAASLCCSACSTHGAPAWLCSVLQRLLAPMHQFFLTRSMWISVSTSEVSCISSKASLQEGQCCFTADPLRVDISCCVHGWQRNIHSSPSSRPEVPRSLKTQRNKHSKAIIYQIFQSKPHLGGTALCAESQHHHCLVGWQTQGNDRAVQQHSLWGTERKSTQTTNTAQLIDIWITSKA